MSNSKAGWLCYNIEMTVKASDKSTALDEERQQQISRALADPTRFKIFQHIAAGHCVACTSVREKFSISAPTISHHLKELETAGLISSEKDGKFLNLTLRRDVWKAYLRALSEI